MKNELPMESFLDPAGTERSDRHLDFTPDEPWYASREADHHYSFQADFALQGLGNGPGECLVIGSPLHEARELHEAGWTVTYADVRIPSNIPFISRFFWGDASKIYFGKDVFDAASSTCVLCHAGLGRYGDPIVEEGDILILKNICRALKPGCRAAITFGSVMLQLKAGDYQIWRVGTAYRIYTVDACRSMALDSGFRILEEKIFDANRLRWRSKDESLDSVLGRDYLSMILQKC